MHAFTALALTLAGSVLAAPAITERATEQENFKLSVVGSEDLNGWAVLEAHVGAGTNAIEIQRPSAFQSEKVHLFGTPKQVNNGHGQLFSHKAAGSKFAWVLPSPPSGQVEQVFSELGGGTNSFGVAGNTQSTPRLTADGSKFGFWACPSKVPGDGKPFTLWYGLGVDSVSLPSQKCESIKLAVNF